VRFSRPVVVPDDDAGAVLTVRGTVEDKREDGSVVVGAARDGGRGQGPHERQAVVRLR
jgi:hypothetical protein